MKRLSVRPSRIEGNGIFSEEHIKKGEVIMIWSINSDIFDEKTYDIEQRSGNKIVIDSGARYVSNYFLWSDKPRIENFINHSSHPNVLYHCGICFAMCDIAPEEELTVDYRYILSENDCAAFIDIKTGKIVEGVNGKQCLKETSVMLLNILCD
jgi:hypothetical protein